VILIRASSDSITQLLQAWSEGNRNALDKLMPLVHTELRRLARRFMVAERPDHTLQPTALVHEAYLRLIDSNAVAWKGRAHFFALSARLMRRILVDFARSRRYQKRGGRIIDVSLDELGIASAKKDASLVALDEALSRLSDIDARKGQVVELRFFGGLSVEETAAMLNISRDTVLRDWKMARLWLLREISAR
jgi:RNA polymerase sigma factor (TIGR02999 family)